MDTDPRLLVDIILDRQKGDDLGEPLSFEQFNQRCNEHDHTDTPGD